MAENLSHKLILTHLVDGVMAPGEEIALDIRQTLTQDATGTLVMLTLEAMNLDRVKTDLSAQYVDHNLLQVDHKNADDHAFLESAANRFGLWFSRAGNGVSHPLHMQYFGAPGETLLGADSHTCATGAIGMLAIGAGGLDVAMAMAGEPYRIPMPEIMGVRLEGALPDGVSAKDVILEMLRRHGVDGGVGRIIEYYGPGVKSLTAMDRHVIANMGAELGATTTVFPSDDETRRFLKGYGREDAWKALAADETAPYDFEDVIDLSSLEPLIATPSSPGNVVPVRELEGETIYQAYIGSSANPGYGDFAAAAAIVKGERVAGGVSFDVNPTTRGLLQELARDGLLSDLIAAGARLHQAGCNGCIGMGQAPATGRNSLRTTPRNFPGRSGTADDRVFLCSPETAAASALAGKITDPRRLNRAHRSAGTARPIVDKSIFKAPDAEAKTTRLVKGPNIKSLPPFDRTPERLSVQVLLKLGDDISTDEIMPAGARVLPFRSNIPRLADFLFADVDETYVERARASREKGGHAIVAGRNYGQGSSREHAALAPRYLGLRVVIAKSFARIHRQNLINYGVLPLLFEDAEDYDAIDGDERLALDNILTVLKDRRSVGIDAAGRSFSATIDLNEREREIVAAGGLINWTRSKHE